MKLAELIDPSVVMSSPPPGAVNVLLGSGVEGPGGRWIPCATKIGQGVFYSGLFQVGPGRRQVCATGRPHECPAEALARAVELATTAAA